MVRGVPQGSILGPLLYILYTNDFAKAFPHNQTILYADDTAVVYEHKNTAPLIQQIDSSVAAIEEWFTENSLSLNLNKTNLIKFGSYGDFPSKITLTNGDCVALKDCVKLLGLHIDKDLKWNSHIEHVSNKINKYIYMIRSINRIVPPAILLNIYHGFVESNLRFCLIFWGSSTKTVDLFKTQKRSLRAIENVSTRQSCRPIFRKHGLLTIYDLYILECAVFVKNNPTLFGRNVSAHEHNTRTKRNYVLNQAQVNVGATNKMLKVFNKLPHRVKELPLKKFKKEIKNYLQNNNFYGINEYFNKPYW